MMITMMMMNNDDDDDNDGDDDDNDNDDYGRYKVDEEGEFQITNKETYTFYFSSNFQYLRYFFQASYIYSLSECVCIYIYGIIPTNLYVYIYAIFFTKK